MDRNSAAATEVTTPIRLEAVPSQGCKFLREPFAFIHRVVFDHVDGRLCLGLQCVNAEAPMPIPVASAAIANEFFMIVSYFDFAPSMIGVACTNLSDFTIFSTVVLYFLK
jgi:hypothetical protein